MQKRNICLIALLLAMSACSKIPTQSPEKTALVGPWKFCITKSGTTQNTRATFRASLLDNNDATLMSDGTYCGYYKNHPQGDNLSWLYPCSTDDGGVAMDAYGNPVQTDNDDEWFNLIDKDSQYALRAAAQQGHTLIMSSPAVRMQKFEPENISGKNIENGPNYHWGFKVDRKTELFISEPFTNLNTKASWIGERNQENLIVYQYIFSLSDGTLFDRRSNVTVKVACGKLSEADIKKVYFRNVMSSAYYMPKSKTYEKPMMDGIENANSPESYNYLEEYYLTNTYNSLLITGTPVVGDKLVVPDDKYIHLVRKEGEDENVTFSQDDEWYEDRDVMNQGYAKIVTAIADFPIFSLDYATLIDDKYKYDGLIPEIIVLSGKDGNIRSTISLPANLEPMKSYTVMIYVSTAYVQAELHVTDWDDKTSQEVHFGETVELPTTSIYVNDWNHHPDHPIEDGTITNTINE